MACILQGSEARAFQGALLSFRPCTSRSSLRCALEVLGELRIVRSISSRGLRRDCRFVLERHLEESG